MNPIRQASESPLSGIFPRSAARACAVFFACVGWIGVSLVALGDPPITPSAVPLITSDEAPAEPAGSGHETSPAPAHPPSAEEDHGTSAPAAHGDPGKAAHPAEASANEDAHEPEHGQGHDAEGTETGKSSVAHGTATSKGQRTVGKPAAASKEATHGRAPTTATGGKVREPAGVERIRETLLDGEPPAGGGMDRSAFESRLEVARRMRRNGNAEAAVRDLVSLLKSAAPNDVKRPALLELASISEDSGQMGRAQQIMAQYTRLFPQHPSVVEVYLRQGLLYREMGATELALAKFHSVFSSALSQRFDQLDYYRRLVLQAQTEIADTYYLNGRWEEAREYLQRVMRLDAPRLTKMLIHYKLLRVLSEMEQNEALVGVAGQFVELYPDAGQLPEVRFLLATALKKAGRNEESLAQVLKLLEAGRNAANDRPEQWQYWQKRAGNDIANQLYREGDYVGTLEIYRRLAELDPSASWQLPVWYQIGLVYERLEQSAKATETYDRIVAREKEAKSDGAAANLAVVVEMARWRRGNLAWVRTATANAATLRPLVPGSGAEGTNSNERRP